MTNVLVVDDNRDFCDALADLLTLSGFTVRAASSARQALEELRAPKAWMPDVLLVDLVMPGMGGLELIEALQAPPALRIPTIVMTGLAERALPAGVHVPLVHKPRLDGLFKLIEDVYRRSLPTAA